MNCSVAEQQVAICSLWSEGIKMSEIYRRMLCSKVNNKHSGLLSKEVISFNNNKRPHSAAATI